MSLALYRKYRPGRFADLVGQEQVTGPLMRALANDRVHHAYLFSGPRGCGKTSSARILARSLNCINGPTPEPCGVCQPCIDLAPNGPGSLDVVEIDAATHRSVENARELRDSAAFAPVSSRYTIYIIDEAHQLTKDAGNALLKLIEEPPAHLRFVFATTEPEKILGTIRSRTHHYAFRLVPVGILRDHLANICSQENIAADPMALALVARAAEGSVRDSLSLLGQLVGSAGEQGITYADAVELIGVTDSRVLDEVVAAVASDDTATLFRIVNEVVDAGTEPRRFATDVLDRLRELMLLQVMPDAASRGVIDVPAEHLPELQQQAQSLGRAELARAADLINHGLTGLRGATSPRLNLEILFARLSLPQAGSTDLDVLARIDRLERRAAELPTLGALAAQAPTAAPASATAPAPSAAPASATAPAPTAAPASAAAPREEPKPVTQPGRSKIRRISDLAPATAPEPAAPAPVTPAPVSAPKQVSLEQVQSFWPSIVEAVKAHSRVAWLTVSQATPIDINADTVFAAVPDAGAVAHFSRTAYPELVSEAMLDVMRVRLRFELIIDPGQQPKSAPKPARNAEQVSAVAIPPESAELEATSTDLASGLTGIALIEAELGGRTIAEYEE